MEFISWVLAELKQHSEALRGFYYIAVGVFGVVGIYFLRQRDKAMQKSSDASEKQADIAEISQLTDQYIKSIDQLGDDSAAIKLGGVYGLEKVASSSNSFYRQVVEVLTSYVRINAVEPKDINKHSPNQVIQAILFVLGRLENDGRVVFDLSDTFLMAYELKGDFSGSKFWRANLQYAQTAEAGFREVEFHKADFTSATLTSVDLTKSGLVGANFSGAELSGAVVDSANCMRATFDKANCYGTSFREAELYDSTFEDAVVSRADFTGVVCGENAFKGAIGLDESVGLINRLGITVEHKES